MSVCFYLRIEELSAAGQFCHCRKASAYFQPEGLPPDSEGTDVK